MLFTSSLLLNGDHASQSNYQSQTTGLGGCQRSISFRIFARARSYIYCNGRHRLGIRNIRQYGGPSKSCRNNSVTLPSAKPPRAQRPKERPLRWTTSLNGSYCCEARKSPASCHPDSCMMAPSIDSLSLVK